MHRDRDAQRLPDVERLAGGGSPCVTPAITRKIAMTPAAAAGGRPVDRPAHQPAKRGLLLRVDDVSNEQLSFRRGN